MRICFIDASTGTLAGGTESIVYNLGVELSKRHQVSLITGRCKEKEIFPHIKNAPFKLITLPYIPRLDRRNENIRSRFRLPLQYDVEAISLFVSFLRSKEARSCVNNSDVVSLNYPMTSLIFSWYLKIMKIPSLFHTPGHVNGRYFFKFNQTDLYLANSWDTERKICEFTGRHADGVVSPGVTLPQIYPQKTNNREHPVLLSVSRLSRAKGVYRTLEIFHYVNREIPGSKLILVGQNFEKEGIVNKAKELGISENIHLTGQMPYTEIGKFYAQADLFIHPSYPESFGMVLLEAMSYGLAIVATDLSCFREATQGTALLLPLEKDFVWSRQMYILWAKEIIGLLRQPQRRELMSVKGKEAALQCTWDKKALEYENFLKEAIRRKKDRKEHG